MSRLKQILGAGLLFCVSTLLPALALAQDRDPKLDSLARDLAAKIESGKQSNPSQGTTYLVLDFNKAAGETTKLGVSLADDFSAAVEVAAPELKAIDRHKFREMCEQQAIDPAIYATDKAAPSAARAFGAELAILGAIEPHGESFVLHIRLFDRFDRELADAGERLDWTDERRSLDLQPVTLPARTMPVWKDIPQAGRNGYSLPECLHCPSPPYAEEARKARITGTILAAILIGEDGKVQEVRIVKGLPGGLTENALASLNTWQFKPVLGPDGKSVVVQSPIQVSFRLF
jgi:TonB family protein